MRHPALFLATALSFAVLFAAPLSAQTPQPPAQGSLNAAPPQPQTSSMPTPRDGREFGQHVSGMAPEHPLEHGGAMFGECVSSLATTGVCPHDHEDEEEE